MNSSIKYWVYQLNLTNKLQQYCQTDRAQKIYISANYTHSMPSHKVDVNFNNRKGGSVYKMTKKTIIDQFENS